MNVTGGIVPKFFRPPYGGLDNRVRAILSKFGLRAVLWNYDTNDWQLTGGTITVDAIYSEVTAWKSQTPGIILEHDIEAVNVNVALYVSANIIGDDQYTANQCVGDTQYQ